MSNFSEKYLSDTSEITKLIDCQVIENIVEGLVKLRKREGRLFFLGSGGGAGHASHAVNDFRKISNIECYTPTDNVSELTARINDDGWDTSYKNWLLVSNFSANDAIFVFSVGGGSTDKNISINLVECIKLASSLGADIYGVVGRDGGFLKKSSDKVSIIPTVDESLVTPHTEGWQAVVWHLVVSHPSLMANQMKWESES
tara:strand:+ start:140 stop:739 length:600 start_codon:yes stop_codon:yes gene_type:complete